MDVGALSQFTPPADSFPFSLPPELPPPVFPFGDPSGFVLLPELPEPAGEPLFVVKLLIVVLVELLFVTLVTFVVLVCELPSTLPGGALPGAFVCVTGPSVLLPFSDGPQQIVRPAPAELQTVPSGRLQ